MVKTNIKLAFVIPLYKTKYLEETLFSLEAQINKKFNVYIGNDNSPENPDSIIKKFSDSLNIKYVHYPNNVGSNSPVKNWNRCLDLLQDEDWVCVLPDDDQLSPNVVEEFYALLNNAEKFPIYAFKMGLKEVSKCGLISNIPGLKSKYYSNYDFFIGLVKGQEGCSLGDVIYNRKRLFEVGRFIDFPRAWSSDHITLSLVASGGYICSLPNSYLVFRMSGDNISSQISDGSEKMNARYLIALWLKKNEQIWNTTISQDLYNYFYWKSEYYFIYTWRPSIKSFIFLFKLNMLMKRPLDFTSPFKALYRRLTSYN